MIELYPNNRSFLIAPESTPELSVVSPVEEFDPTQITDLEQAEHFVRGVRNGYWSHEYYRRNRQRANIEARRAVANIVYWMRPPSGDMSSEAAQKRKAMFLVVEASDAVIKGIKPFSNRAEDNFLYTLSGIIAERNKGSDNVVGLGSNAT